MDRRIAFFLVVVLLVVAGGTMLLIGLLRGDRSPDSNGGTNTAPAVASAVASV